MTIALSGPSDPEQRGVIFRLVSLKGMMGLGMYWIVPVVDQKIQLDVRAKAFMTIKVNAVLYDRILNGDMAVIRVKNYQMAVIRLP